MILNNPQATEQAVQILRSGQNYQWYVITLALLVAYVYGNEYEKGNFRNLAAGLGLYMVHWFVEIVNALIHHFTGHALWTVPTGTAFLILIGVCIEISLMFAVAGIVTAKILPKSPKARILGINSRIFATILSASIASILEIFFVRTPAFVWVYPAWGAFPVFVTVYVPFFAAACICHDAEPKNSWAFICALAAINIAGLAAFGILGWI